MSCRWCGSEAHSSKECKTKKLVEFLNSNEVVAPANLPKIVVVSDAKLVDAIEEAHALLHIKRGDSE